MTEKTTVPALTVLSRFAREWPNTNNSPFGLDWGLNVMSPLVHGNIAFTKEIRVRANIGPSKSSDNQIKHWAVFNPTAKSRWSVKSKGPVFKRDFNKALDCSVLHGMMFSACVRT